MANAKFSCSLLGPAPHTVRIDLVFDDYDEAEAVFRQAVKGLEEEGKLQVCIADLVIGERRGIAKNG